MAMKDLVDPNCGGPNSLMKVTSHFTQDRAFRQENLLRRRLGLDPTLESRPFTNDLDEDLFVQEFLAQQHGKINEAPQTFRMQNLLTEMQAIEQMSFQTVQGPSVAELASSEEWASEYLKTEEKQPNVSAEDWSQEFVERAIPDGAPPDILWAEQYLDGSTQLESENWAQEFTSDGDGLAAAAREFVESVKDPKFTSTQFMNFVKRLGDGGFIGGLPESEEDKWASEFSGVKDFAAEQLEGVETPAATGRDKEDFWDRLEKEWEHMSKDGSGEHPWLSDYEAMADPYKEYKMNEENPLMDHPDPFAEGLRLLKEGDLPSAVLLFESAAQKTPEDPLIWQYLGTSQAENENDYMAIAALKKCVEIQPDNLTALMALAVSYTNESFQVQACYTLQQWLKANAKYSSLVPNDISNPPRPGVMSILNDSLHREVCDQFMTAARLSPSDPDPDVQCGLGVLFNLSGEYDKAVDCFTAALNVKPGDSLLWNKLGATLANGKRSEEAIEAYHQALQISPGFVRSRYNLGISCINLKSYKESAEHFLTALNLQAVARGIPGANKNSSMSDSIWSTFRLLVSLLERSDLYGAVDAKDLEALNKEFGISS